MGYVFPLIAFYASGMENGIYHLLDERNDQARHFMGTKALNCVNSSNLMDIYSMVGITVLDVPMTNYTTQ